jgi:hypothetical protein
MSIYRFSLQFNDSYAFRDHPRLTGFQRVHQELIPDMSGAMRPGIRRCDACGALLGKWEEAPAGLVIKKRRYDIASTYDGVLVGSRRFKTTYEDGKLRGLVFRQLPDDVSFFAIWAERAVPFDADRRKTRFINPCSVCGHFESVVGATPVYLKSGALINAQELVRTDLEFGSDDEKSPLLICGEIAARTCSFAKLKGVDLWPIEDPA